MSLKSACQTIERKGDDKPVFFIIILALVAYATLRGPEPVVIPETKVLFENKNTICFQQEDIGTWCVEKNIKDRY